MHDGPGRSGRRPLAGRRPRVDQLLLGTGALVAATILLGVATKAAGAGLACDANWPLCDGGLLDLFPATVPSAFEWIHRVVAMVTGIAILVTAIAAVRSDRVGRRVAAAVVLGAALTPLQVALGRETVLSYEMTVLSLHFWTAIAIFVLFVAATVVVWSEAVSARSVRWSLLAVAAAVPLHVILSPLVVANYTPVVQTIQYAVVLWLIAGIGPVALLGPRRLGAGRPRAGLAAATALTAALIVLGRRSVMTLSPTLDLAYGGVALALVLVCLWTVRVGRRGETSPPRAAGRDA